MSAKLAKRRWETRFLKRIAMPLDHEFYDRVYDLGMVQLNFDTYEELSKYSDCKYIFHCGMSTKGLESRVESLNRVGDLLWVDPTDWDMENQKIDRYAWLNVAADVFLLRLIEVVAEIRTSR